MASMFPKTSFLRPTTLPPPPALLSLIPLILPVNKEKKNKRYLRKIWNKRILLGFYYF
jgi:hypothetical protein